MFSGLGFNSVTNDLQREIANYTKQHEPPLFDQVLRVLLNMNSDIEYCNGETYLNINNIKFLESNDKIKERVSIIIPCKNISEELKKSIDLVLQKFNYKPVEMPYSKGINELRLDYKI